MSTNPFARLRRLLPPAPVLIGKVIFHHTEDDTSTLELPTGQGIVAVAGPLAVGSRMRARGTTVAVGENAFVRNGVIENRAPNGTPVEIVIGEIAAASPGFTFNGPIPTQTATASVPFTLGLSGYWAGGTSPRTYSIVSGTLPTGLSLNSTTGVISGSPAATTSAVTVTVRVTDAQLRTSEGSVTFGPISAAAGADGGPWDPDYDGGAPNRMTYSEGNALATFNPSTIGSGASFGVRTAAPVSGKVYCEFELVTRSGTGSFHSFGLTRVGTSPIILYQNVVGIYSRSPNINAGCGLDATGVYVDGTKVSGVYPFEVGQRIGIAVDTATGHVWWRRNGTWLSGDPEAGTGAMATLPSGSQWVFCFSDYTCTDAGISLAVRIYPDAGVQSGSMPAGFVAYGGSSQVETPPDPGTTTLTPASDSRTVFVLDSDRAPSTYPSHLGLQLYTGQTTWELNDLASSGNVLKHADGVTNWVGLENGAYVSRLKQGQALFSSNTARAEYHGPSTGNPSNLPFVIDENATHDYWFGIDISFDDDIVSNTGVQSWGGPNVMSIMLTHGITWGDMPQSAGQDFGFRLEGNVLVFQVIPPGSGTQTFDVRTTPLSTTVVGTGNGGGAWGAARFWKLANLVAGQRLRIVIRARLNNTNTGSPRVRLWMQQGDTGAFTKRIDYSGPNIFSDGVRYWKVGLYGYDNEVLNSAWWGNKTTRTMRFFSNLVIRDAAGTPTLDENELFAWLSR